jgi:hypothetical protein
MDIEWKFVGFVRFPLSYKNVLKLRKNKCI